MNITTITYNDPGISWGPAVHFLELWNECASADDALEIVGYAPSWSGKDPIIKPAFDLRLRRVPSIGGLRQVIWDFIVATIILKNRDSLIYIRIGTFHFFSVLILGWLGSRVAIEVNGRATHDHKSAGSSIWRRWIAEWGEARLLKRAEIVFSVTPELVEYSRASNPKARHVHVDNGVSRRFYNVMRNEQPGFRFIYVGTFTPWDGAAELIELASERPDLRFRMVGDGARRAELERTAPGNVEFRGWVAYSELVHEYEACDAGIVLYERERHEHISMASLKTREYLAAALPIFSTRVRGQEFIEERAFGLLSSGPLTKDLDTFLANYDLYKRNLVAARTTILEEFSWAATARKTTLFLRAL
jgi:glycosyltransferase involved in cell wall biosynthesis